MLPAHMREMSPAMPGAHPSCPDDMGLLFYLLKKYPSPKHHDVRLPFPPLLLPPLQ